MSTNKTIEHPANGTHVIHLAYKLGWQALGPSVACTALSTTVVAARWYTRRKLSQCVGLDDYVIVLSLVSFVRTFVLADYMLTSD